MDDKKVNQGVFNKLLAALQPVAQGIANFQNDNPVKRRYEQFAAQPIGSGNSTMPERYARGLESFLNAPGARTTLSAPSGYLQGANFGMGTPLDKALYQGAPRTMGQEALASTGFLLGTINPYSIPAQAGKGITAVTNPLLSQINSKIANPIAARLAAGGLNALQGEAVSRGTTGRENGVLGGGIDFLSGVAFGPKAFASTKDDKAKDAIIESVEKTLKNVVPEVMDVKTFDDKAAIPESMKGFLEEAPTALPSKADLENTVKELVPEESLKAAAETMMDQKDGEKWLSKTAGFEDSLKRTWENFVGRSQAADIAGEAAAVPFKKYDNQGESIFDDIQQGGKGLDGDVRAYFDKRYEQLKDAGINFSYRKDYLPQLWADDSKVVAQKLGKAFSQKGKGTFTLERLFETYKEGKAAGLTPRFNKVSDLVKWYEGATEKAMTQKKFFDDLVENGFLLTQKAVGKRELQDLWKPITAEGFGYDVSWKTPKGKKIMSGKYYAPSALADTINNYFNADGGFIENLAVGATAMKNRVATGGVPLTGVNAHGHNVVSRFVLSGQNPFSRAWKGTEWLLNPRSASNFVQKNLDRAVDWRRAGLTFDVEDKNYLFNREAKGGVVGETAKSFDQFMEKTFSEPLFKKVIPAMKITAAEEIFKSLKAGGLSDDEAMRTASRQTNELLGGINYDMIGRDKQFQNVMRLALFAPDWAETQIRLGKGVVESAAPKNWNDPRFKVYRTFARNYIASFTAFSVANKALSGHWPWQNDPGNLFNLDTGTYTEDGKKRYVRQYGTATDFVRIPMEVAAGVMQGDLSAAGKTVRNRLSTPLGGAVSALSNTDYMGRPLWAKDDYGNPLSTEENLLGTVRLISGMTAPSFVQEGAAFAGGQTSGEEALTGVMELPVRYSGGAYSANQKEERDALKERGADGQDIYQYFEQSREAKKEDQKALDSARSSTGEQDGILSRIFGGNKEASFTKAADKRIAKKQKDLIAQKLDGGAEVSPEELAFYYLDEFESKPAKGVVGQQEKLDEAYKLALKFNEDTRLTPENRAYLTDALGLDPKDVEYYSMASKTDDLKTTFAAQYLLSDKMATREGLREFIDMRKEVSGKQILTDTVINNLRENGFLDKELAKDLKSVRYNPFKQALVFGKGESSGGSGRKARLDTTVSLPGKIGLPGVSETNYTLPKKTKLASISGVSKKNRARLKTKGSSR
jgi:hypothetical protein